jgi:hypothetical protein
MNYNKQFKLAAEAKYTFHFLSFQKLVITLQVKKQGEKGGPKHGCLISSISSVSRPEKKTTVRRH